MIFIKHTNLAYGLNWPAVHSFPLIPSHHLRYHYVRNWDTWFVQRYATTTAGGVLLWVHLSLRAFLQWLEHAFPFHLVMYIFEPPCSSTMEHGSSSSSSSKSVMYCGTLGWPWWPAAGNPFSCHYLSITVIAFANTDTCTEVSAEITHQWKACGWKKGEFNVAVIQEINLKVYRALILL